MQGVGHITGTLYNESLCGSISIVFGGFCCIVALWIRVYLVGSPGTGCVARWKMTIDDVSLLLGSEEDDSDFNAVSCFTHLC